MYLCFFYVLCIEVTPTLGVIYIDSPLVLAFSIYAFNWYLMCHKNASLLHTGKGLILQERGSLFCKCWFPPLSMIQSLCKNKLCICWSTIVI